MSGAGHFLLAPCAKQPLHWYAAVLAEACVEHGHGRQCLAHLRNLITTCPPASSRAGGPAGATRAGRAGASGECCRVGGRVFLAYGRAGHGTTILCLVSHASVLCHAAGASRTDEAGRAGAVETAARWRACWQTDGCGRRCTAQWRTACVSCLRASLRNRWIRRPGEGRGSWCFRRQLPRWRTCWRH